MLFIYNFFISLYSFLISLVARFKPKARLLREGRKQTFPYLIKELKDNTQAIGWFHCASLGEFEQARPIIERFREDFPKFKILVSFFSPSGYEIRKNYDKADYVCYLPADTASNAERFIELVQPQVAFFVKYEFWHHFIHRLHARQIPTLSVSSIFRQEQHFFKWHGSFARKTLRRFQHIFVQDKASLDLMKSIKIQNTSISGDTRFDQVYATCSKPQEFPLVQRFKQDKQVMIVGSSWPEDLEVLMPLINNTDKDLRFIIAPHEIDEENISILEQKIKKSAIRYSEATLDTVDNYQVLIVNNVGMLSSLYQYGNFAYVGGAFGDGLHNILEAATFGMPVFFGNKNYKKFREAVDLIDLEVAFSIGDSHQLLTKFYEIYKNTDKQLETALLAKTYVQKHLGATDRIMAYCKEILN